MLDEKYINFFEELKKFKEKQQKQKERQNIIGLEFEYDEYNKCVGYKLKNKLIELLIKN